MKIVFKCKTCGRIIVVESELHPIGSQKNVLIANHYKLSDMIDRL